MLHSSLPVRSAFALLVLLALAAAACAGDATPVQVSDAWARTSPQAATAGAVYLELTSDADDRLIGASVADDVAAVVEIHETVAAGMSDDDDTDGEGMQAMLMQEVGSIDLPAGETVVLEPGGLHIMLLDLVAPLEVGTDMDVTLEFEDAGSLVVEVEVRDDAP